MNLQVLGHLAAGSSVYSAYPAEDWENQTMFSLRVLNRIRDAHPSKSMVTWRADEMYVKVKGNEKWLFAMMDDETRFWIAQQMTDGKYRSNVRPLFAEAKRLAGKRPTILITDGCWHFNRPFQKEF